MQIILESQPTPTVLRIFNGKEARFWLIADRILLERIYNIALEVSLVIDTKQVKHSITEEMEDAALGKPNHV